MPGSPISDGLGMLGGETAANALTAILMPGVHTIYIDEPFVKWKRRHGQGLVLKVRLGNLL